MSPKARQLLERFSHQLRSRRDAGMPSSNDAENMLVAYIEELERRALALDKCLKAYEAFVRVATNMGN